MRFLLFVLFWIGASGVVLAQTTQSRAALEAEKKKNLEKINQVKKILSETQKEKKTSMSEARAIQQQIENQQKKIALAQQDYELIHKEMELNSLTQDSLKKQLAVLQKEYADIIVRESKNSSKLTKMGFLFSSHSVTELFMRYKYLKQYSENRKEKFEKMRELTSNLEKRKKELAEGKIRQSQVIQQVSEDKKGLDELKSKQDKIVKELTSKEGQLKVELKKQQQALNQLNSTISLAIAREQALRKAEEEARAKEAARIKAAEKAKEEARLRDLAKAKEAERLKAEEAKRLAAAKAKEESKVTAKPKEEPKAAPAPKVVEPKKEVAKIEPKEEPVRKVVEETVKPAKVEAPSRTEVASINSGKFSAAKSRLAWPVSGFVSGKFGVRDHAVLKGIKVDNHGIDIRTSAGATVRAVFEGTVLDVSSIPGLNFVVAIQHGDYYTVYANLETVIVRPNQKISGREMIGTVAEKDGVPEINFQIWHNFTKLNPELWLGSK